MAKKAELLEKAKKLKLEVTEKNTIKEIEAALAEAQNSTEPDADGASKEEHPKETIAKAGKRSTKALKEAEEKAAKEERKAHADEVEAKPKKPIKVRSKLERKGKKYREAAKLVDKSKLYSAKEALELAIKTSTTKFDASIEAHIKLGVDPRHADQNIRATIILPQGTGKTVKVAVFCDADNTSKAKNAGADIAQADEFLQTLEKGKLDFDVLIATPSVMPKLGKYAKVLGPKGLMPSPKSGTVTTDVVKAVKEAKAGKIEYRVDSNGIVHLPIGKVSFGVDKLQENFESVYTSVKSAKPASIKGNYFQNIFITSTMGPSIKLDLTSL